MSLGAQKGTVLTFCISGEDEEKACAEMERFCKEQWGNGVPINEYE
jgi:phosphotransferase system HPr-like phosphotransfer protein